MDGAFWRGDGLTPMPLQNRVDPFSGIHAVSARGLFTGNRGILHDPETRTLKKQSWATEGWVICTLAPLPGREKRSALMSKGRWTELFFLDEAVGLAAGHRPCYACRKAEAKAFRDAVGFDRVSKLNRAINDEMKPHLRARNPEPRSASRPADLPDGAFFAIGGVAFLKWQDSARAFTWQGYGPPEVLPDHALRLTPLITCEALRSGYSPVMHPSLER